MNLVGVADFLPYYNTDYKKMENFVIEVFNGEAAYYSGQPIQGQVKVDLSGEYYSGQPIQGQIEVDLR